MDMHELLELRDRLIQAKANKQTVGAAAKYAADLEAEAGPVDFNGRRYSVKHLLALVEKVLKVRSLPKPEKKAKASVEPKPAPVSMKEAPKAEEKKAAPKAEKPKAAPKESGPEKSAAKVEPEKAPEPKPEDPDDLIG